MRVKRLLLAGVIAAGLVLAGPGTASAHLVFCAGDPPVNLTTPGGHNVTVNNYLYVSPAYRHLASQVTADGFAEANGAGSSRLVVHIHIPGGLSGLYVVSNEQRFHVTSTGTGRGGTDITLTLDVPES
jgi:hypothetical protein